MPTRTAHPDLSTTGKRVARRDVDRLAGRIAFTAAGVHKAAGKRTGYRMAAVNRKRTITGRGPFGSGRGVERQLERRRRAGVSAGGYSRPALGAGVRDGSGAEHPTVPPVAQG